MNPIACATTLARLAVAFSSLNGQGWFTDTGSHWCLTDAVDAVPDGCPYALIHQQDVEHLEQAGVIFVAYGATDEHGGALDDDALLDVGRQLHQTLLTHGLPAFWTGDIHHRIQVGGTEC